MIKTKQELLTLGFTDEGNYGVSKIIPDTFRSDWKIMVNENDVYFVNFNRAGDDRVNEISEGLSNIAFRAPEAAGKAKELLKGIGYDFEELEEKK